VQDPPARNRMRDEFRYIWPAFPLCSPGCEGVFGAMIALLRENSAGEAGDRRVQPRYWPSLGTIAKIGALLTLCAAGWFVHGLPWSHWNPFYELALGFVAAVFAAVVVGRRLRHALIVVASVVLSLAVAEAYALIVSAPPTEIRTPGYSLPHPVLGWWPGHPGVFHHRKLDRKTGSVIYDIDYTVDEHGNRQVISAPTGTSVAFFGDSMTFGQGLPDAETLPQAFADATGHQLHVLNLAFPGYGPQQFLRALETDMFRQLLTEPRLFVLLTAPWHSERSACKSNFVLQAPRYVMVDGQPAYQGNCVDQWPVWLRYWITRTAIYSVFLEPVFGGAGPADLDLYVSILTRAGQLARERYGVPTLVLYQPYDAYVRRAGFTDLQIMQRLREGGLLVIDAGLNPDDFPGQNLNIPGDGHPTGVANRAWAVLVRDALAGLPAQAH
jgi:hypothetical protein